MSGVLDRHKREEENERRVGSLNEKEREGVSGHHYFCFKIGEIERLM